MSRLFYHTMQDNLGNLLFDVSGTMRLAGTGTLATIYGDEAMTVILPNPMTNHPSYGSFKCFLPVGDFDFYMAKAGYSFETLTGVQGYGSMAQQEASAVAITGGSLAGLGQVGIGTATPTQPFDVVGSSRLQRLGLNTAPDPSYSLACNGDVIIQPGNLGIGMAPTQRLQVAGNTRLERLGVNRAPAGDVLLHIDVTKNTNYGMALKTADADAGANATVLFANLAGTAIGSITTTAAATAYNTASDARLKTAVHDLTGELALIQALRPVSFVWNADDAPGVGFLASEVAAVVQGVITGEEGAVDAAGGIVPQQIDHSKLVPWLVGACKTLAAKLEAAEARLAILEDALGI